MEEVPDSYAQELVEDVIREIKRQRDAKGISMYRLSKLTGLHASTISLIERGKRSPSLFVLVKMTKALGISLGSILGECERPKIAGEESDWSEPQVESVHAGRLNQPQPV